VTNYLRGRFEQDKIYLMGQSWGTILGVLAVQQEPDLYQCRQPRRANIPGAGPP
jgi:hypothetical protein